MGILIAPRPTASAVLPRHRAQCKRLLLWASGGSWQGIARMDPRACRQRDDIHAHPYGGSWRTGITPPHLHARTRRRRSSRRRRVDAQARWVGSWCSITIRDYTPPGTLTLDVSSGAQAKVARAWRGAGAGALEPARRGQGRGLSTEELTPHGAKVHFLAASPLKNKA